MTPRNGRPPTRELVQRQARALGDPTRYDIYRFVAESRAPGELHRGLAAGILDGMQSDMRLRDLIVHPPAEAGCRLQFERRPLAPAPAS